MFNASEAVDSLIYDINLEYMESCYDAIYEELCARVENGELSLEDAQIINKVAAEKYYGEGFMDNLKKAGKVAKKVGHTASKVGSRVAAHVEDEYKNNPEFQKLVDRKGAQLNAKYGDKISSVAGQIGKAGHGVGTNIDRGQKVLNKVSNAAHSAGEVGSAVQAKTGKNFPLNNRIEQKEV